MWIRRLFASIRRAATREAHSHLHTDEGTPSDCTYDPATEQVEHTARIAEATACIAKILDDYIAEKQSADKEDARRNGNILKWTKRASIGSVVYTILTLLIFGANVR